MWVLSHYTSDYRACTVHELDLRHQRVNTIVNSLISLHSFIYDLITRIAIFNQYEKKTKKKKEQKIPGEMIQLIFSLIK